jgi:hypothetical protein
MPIVLKSGEPQPSWNPQGLYRPVMGLLYLYLYLSVRRQLEPTNEKVMYWLTMLKKLKVRNV